MLRSDIRLCLLSGFNDFTWIPPMADTGEVQQQQQLRNQTLQNLIWQNTLMHICGSVQGFV